MSIKWDEVARVVVDLVKSNPSWRFPTVRSIFYYLGSPPLELIPLTKYGYKKLDEIIVKLRKKGQVPWGYFEVKRGETVPSRTYIDPEQYLYIHIDELKECWRYYEVPLWYRQEYVVEVWVEKKGLLPTFEHILMDYDVTIRAAEGYASWEFVYSAVKEIKDRYFTDRSGQQVIVLYFGDLDPSGIDIDRHVEEAIKFFDVDLKFRRLALHPQQIEEWGLPLWPEKMETIAKIMRDPRRKWYFERYGKIACELDSLVAKAYDKLEDLLRSEIEKLLDKSILRQRNEVNEKHREWLKAKLENMRITFEG